MSPKYIIINNKKVAVDSYEYKKLYPNLATKSSTPNADYQRTLPDITITAKDNSLKGKINRSLNDWGKYVIQHSDTSSPASALATSITVPFQIPQDLVTKAITGKWQKPSEALNIKNPIGATATDMVLDPVNLVGAGIGTKFMRGKIPFNKLNFIKNKIYDLPKVNGVDELFNSNKLLSNVGTKQQYIDYLKLKYPNKESIDINYHGGNTPLENFVNRRVDNEVGVMNGMYFTPDIKYAKTYSPEIKRVILDMKNPLQTEGNWTGIINDDVKNSILKNGNDGIINNMFDNSKLKKVFYKYNLDKPRRENIVFNKNQIYELGTESDISNFKNFVNNPDYMIESNKKGGSSKNWIKGAVNPEHKGYCTPMTKSTCTPRRKALARTFKKMVKEREEK